MIEVSKRMRDILVREGRVYVKWRACNSYHEIKTTK